VSSEYTRQLTSLRAGKKLNAELLKGLQLRGCWEGKRTTDNHLKLRHIPTGKSLYIGTTRHGSGSAPLNIAARIRRIERGLEPTG
jgi:hypothetical protein